MVGSMAAARPGSSVPNLRRRRHLGVDCIPASLFSCLSKLYCFFTITTIAMFDQLKSVIARPLVDGNRVSSAEKRFGVANSLPLDDKKPDASTAFERSGWAFI